MSWEQRFIRYKNNIYYDYNLLYKRGWTDDLIVSLLKVPDQEEENQKLFSSLRVLDQESTKVFINTQKLSVSKTMFKKQRLEEKNNLIREFVDINSYKDFFPKARSLKRNIKIIVGPTNSGKTHDALQHLLNSESGSYLAPLRLLALEKFEEINSKGKICNLITGEEKQVLDDAHFNSQTIETFDVHNFNETVIIDEVQMLFDQHRGWAWTRAIFGAYCNNLYLIGSENSVEILKKIFDLLGESVEIVYKQRLQPLKIGRSYDNKLSKIPNQSALICFSRKQVLLFKDELERMNKKVSIIYGSLSPEIRKRQAEMFTNGETDILVSTDAIGMGLNLSIKEIIFSETSKFDGKVNRPLTVAEVKQISGRAGRYGIHDYGYVSSLHSNQLSFIGSQLNEPYVQESTIYVFPSLEQITLLSSVLKSESICYLVKFFAQKCIRQYNSIFSKNNYDQVILLAQFLDDYFPEMALERKYGLLGIPVNFNAYKNMNYFSSWVNNIESNKIIRIDSFVNFYNDEIKMKYSFKNGLILQRLEDCQKAILVYKALALKYPSDPESNAVMNHIYNECDKLILDFLIERGKTNGKSKK